MAQDHKSAPELDRFLVALGILAALLITAGVSAGSSGPKGWLDPGWVFAQSALLVFPMVIVALAAATWARRLAVYASFTASVGLPVLMMVDRFSHGWIGERFLSAATLRVVTEIPFTLLGEASVGMFLGFAVLVFAVIAAAFSLPWAAKRIARRWANSHRIPGPHGVLGGAIALAVALAVPSLRDFGEAKQAMAENSTRHPLCVVGLVPHRSVGKDIPVVASKVTEFTDRLGALTARDHHQRRLAIVDETRSMPLPDIVIVVVESFRHELVDPDVMPNLSRLAESGIHCRNHFSGGNATNHGLFTLLNGLDAVWHDRPIRYSPLMNRLLRSAGYEIGFFASHDRWRNFYMDGYINDEHFDEFVAAPPNGIAGDRKATERALAFLNRSNGSDSERQPRLALLYLYATHAIYDSYAEDRVFLPAADDRMLFPYTPSARSGVWNRYRNSARSVDRLINAVVDQNRIIIVAGDHGEAFLEDGTIGHGIRLSKVQNMTPAIIYVPKLDARTIEAPTYHADLLPTLLSAIGVQTTDSTLLDGLDLLTANDLELTSRVFSTRNYLDRDVALVGPWTNMSDQPFAVRASVSMRDGVAKPLNAIDTSGDLQPTQIDLDQVTQRWFARLLGIRRDASDR